MAENADPSSIQHPQGLLPAFSARQYSHLPTPQSPNTLGRYVHDRAHSPESPVPTGVTPAPSTSQNRLSGSGEMDLESSSSRPQSTLKQIITPESSPHFSSSIPLDPAGSATPPYFVPSSSHDYATPKQNSAKADRPDSRSGATASRASRTPTITSEHSQPSAILSSPFVVKSSSIGNGVKQLATSSDERPVAVDDVFSSSQPDLPTNSLSTPPMPSSKPPVSDPGPAAGGEMERVRQRMMEDRLALMQEAEKRRPDYLKRSKRTLSEVDPNYLEEEENERSIGIMESPQKGRRLKLFQETSEESFEESLMAGGYGRYRTADWVRQPQPISLPSSTAAGSSTIISLLEEAEENPPSEKELRKRKRLAAFRESSQQNNTRLCAVELEGKGRVLIDVPSEELVTPASPEPTPSRKRAQNRRKKKSSEAVPSKKALGLSENTNDHLEKPNWPDTEFPWRLRTEERLELAKAVQEERLRWIEKYLDRDSDDEDEEEFDSAPEEISPEPYDYVSEPPLPGRGKMVPPMVYPGVPAEGTVRRRQFLIDPADARAALMSKRSVRFLSFRRRRRQKERDEEDDEVVCICNGRDDGRELVQCDACQTWYHLQCIGIKSVAELGKEEDPWFCRRCVVRSPSPSTEPYAILSSEPTFVPSEEPSEHRYSDTPFFQPGLQDSPHWSSSKIPRTPTTGYQGHLDSHSSWVESSRAGPSTPKHSATSVRIYSSPYGGYPEESPFDPTSTPSRGIKFNPSFTTPKSHSWMPRGSANLFQTPSRPSVRSHGRLSAGMSLGADDNLPHHMPPHEFLNRPYDESPIRRSDDAVVPRRILHSPPRTRPSTQSHSFLEESPVVRSAGSHLPKE